MISLPTLRNSLPGTTKNYGSLPPTVHKRKMPRFRNPETGQPRAQLDFFFFFFFFFCLLRNLRTSGFNLQSSSNHEERRKKNPQRENQEPTAAAAAVVVGLQSVKLYTAR
jgi:hypothetical protein